MHASLSHALIFFTLIAGASTHYVVFRMDDIQDYWDDNAQTAVISLFQSLNVPLSFGIIGNNFGLDADHVANIRKYITDAKSSGWQLEVANHGYNHEEFIRFSYADQLKLMQDAIKQTVGNLTGAITAADMTTFIPPYNYFNDDTVKAAKDAGFKVISSDISWYSQRSYPGSNAAFREFPVGAASTDMSDSYRISAEESFQAIQQQIAATSTPTTQGFSAVMMHFVEFMKADGSAVDQASINDLEKLIKMCKDAGYIMTTFNRLDALMTGKSSPSPSPAPAAATTAKVVAAPSTTGKVAAPATTGMASTPAPVTTAAKVVAPATTAKVATPVPSTTGKVATPVPSTTGKVATPAPSTTGKALTPSGTPMACNAQSGEFQQCSSSTGYNWCANGGYVYPMTCAPGTACRNVDSTHIECYDTRF